MKDMYAKSSKGIKTKKMTMERFEDSPEDKKADAAAMAKMNKSSKYADGVDAIEIKKSKVDLPAASTIPATIRTASRNTDRPNFIGPPTETKVKADKETSALDAVVKESPSQAKTNVPVTTMSLAQVADMNKVKQHQEKLNKYGANLKVDGMWGAKTEAASRDLYPQYKEKSVLSKSGKAPISDSRMQGLSGSSGKDPVQAKSSGIKTASKTVVASVPAIQTQATDIKTASKSPTINTKALPYTANTLSSYSKPGASKEFVRQKEKEAFAAEKVSRFNDKITTESAGNQGMREPEEHGRASSLNPTQARQVAIIDSGITDAMRAKKLDPDNPKHVEQHIREEADKEYEKSKPLDGKDLAIYGAEAAGPAIANGIKGGGKYASMAKAALRFGPGIADFVKTSIDDKDSTATQYLGSAAKAATRAGILGTAGSVAAGTISRTGKGLINAGKEAGAISAMRREASAGLDVAKATKAAAKSVSAKNKAGKLVLQASKEVKEATSMRLSPRASIGDNLKEAASETVAGKVYNAVTNNPITRGIKVVKSFNKENKQADLAIAAKVESKATSVAAKVTSEENAKLAKEGEVIAAKAETAAQAKLDKINQEKYGYKSTPTVDRAQEDKIRAAENRANNTPSAKKRETTAILAKENEAYGLKVKARNAEPIPETPTTNKPPLLLQQESNSTKSANAQLRTERDVKIGKETRAGIRTSRTENAAREAALNKKAPLLLDAQTPSTKQAKAVEKSIAEDAANVYNNRRDKLLGERAEINKSIQTRGERLKAEASAAKRKITAQNKKIKKQVEAIDAKQNRMFDYN